MATDKSSFWLTPKGFAALGLIFAASYFLLIEHREHVFPFLPFLIFLLCPFMHFFMHGGHGGHDGHDQQGGESDQQQHPVAGHNEKER